MKADISDLSSAVSPASLPNVTEKLLKEKVKEESLDVTVGSF
jgi:hypothetical protein